MTSFPRSSGRTHSTLCIPKKTKDSAKRDAWGWYDRSTKVLYHPVMYAFSSHLKHRKEIEARRSEITDSLEDFYRDDSLAFEGQSTNHQDIIERKKLFLEFLDSFTH